MTINPQIEKERIIQKFELLSLKYHKLSLVFNELAQSLRVESRNKSLKDFKVYLKSLRIDIKKLEEISKADIETLKFKDIQKEVKQ